MSEVIKFNCSYCVQRLGVKAAFAGKRVRCTKCRTVLTVPQENEEPAPVKDFTEQADLTKLNRNNSLLQMDVDDSLDGISCSAILEAGLSAASEAWADEDPYEIADLLKEVSKNPRKINKKPTINDEPEVSTSELDLDIDVDGELKADDLLGTLMSATDEEESDSGKSDAIASDKSVEKADNKAAKEKNSDSGRWKSKSTKRSFFKRKK